MKIILSGATGRMGQEIRALVDLNKKFKIVGIIGRHQPIRDKVAADVLIDFSQPQFLKIAIETAVRLKIPLVSGTTGLDAKQISLLKSAAKKIPVLWAPNMSIGIQAIRRMLSALESLKHYKFSIDDIHHVKKKDAPSGTAIYLQRNLEKRLNKKVPNINSVREGDVFGIHRIIAVGPEEKIVIEHEAFNRTVFARGALTCAKWIQKKKKGFFSMEDVING